MSTKLYTVTMKSGETLKFYADFSQASSPIIHIDDEGCEHATEYQVGSFSHDWHYAVQTLIKDAGEDFWLEPDAKETEDDDGTPLYDGVTADLYIDSQIKSIT